MKFKRIKYRIDGFTDLVTGYAFEIPGWPEFHACVRYGNRYGDDVYPAWVLDHYETGKAINSAGEFKKKERAPAELEKLLNKMGRERVHAALRRCGCL